MMRVAINGFGRIGRNFLRSYITDPAARKAFDIALINVGPASIKDAAYFFKYDTLLGTFAGSVKSSETHLEVDGYRIAMRAERDPEAVKWDEHAISWVVDCSGKFTHREQAERHLNAGAQHVLISAPAKNEDISIIPGVNEAQFDAAKHRIVSLGSCTTNAFVPMIKVLQDAFGIERGMMTTIHAYTNSQVLLDVDAGDPRRSRAAALNIIPTTTGATKMVGKIFPHLADRVTGVAVRVPVGKVSLIDFSFTAQKELSSQSINNAFKQAKLSMPGIMAMNMEPLVSSDYSGNNFSVVIDGLLTDACGNMGKVFGWYDNEWAYSVRLKDFLMFVCR